MTRGPSLVPVLAVSAVVFDAAGRVLVVERGQPPGVGLWSVPGGRLELGETLADAVRREVREETGLEIDVGPLVEIVERVTATDDGTYHYVILDYLGRATGGALAAGDDVHAVRWVTDDELAVMSTTAGLAPVIARARGMLPFPVAKPVTTG